MKSPAIISIRRRLPANCRNSSPRANSVLPRGRPPLEAGPFSNCGRELGWRNRIWRMSIRLSGPGPGSHPSGAGPSRLLPVCRLSDARRCLVELHEMERPDLDQAVRRRRQLCPGFHPGPGVLDRGAQHCPVDRPVGRLPARDRLCAGARAEPEHSRPKPASRAFLYARYYRADRRRDHVAMDVRPVLRPVQRNADGARPAGSHSGLARRPQRRALFDVRRLCLADGRIFARPVSRRIAERVPDAD